ncbi:MAG: hypothetical protein M3Q29_25485 [Chloroflexota bacterium]|nr:hypothetical protein [Chloroflexota bacterium]
MEHGEVDPVSAEQRLHDGQVGPVAVGGHLHPVAQPGLQIRQEHVGIVGRALPDEPRRDQLGVGVYGRPRPHVAVAEGALVLFGHVLLFGVAERPDFVALDPPARQVGEHGVLVVGAGFAQVGQQLDDGVLRHASDPDRGSDAHAFDEAADDLGTALGAHPVHTDYYA